MFGNTNPPQQQGIFAQQQQQNSFAPQPPATFGLFANSTLQQPGNNPMTATSTLNAGGMFGNNNNNNNNNISGFGGGNNKPPGGGLFGGNTAIAPTNGGGLFGNTQNTGQQGGIFGGGNNNIAPSGSNFMGQTNNGSVLGGQQPAQPNTFGGFTGNNTQGTSMFGNNVNAAKPSTFMTNNTTPNNNMFNSNTSGFNKPAAGIFGNVNTQQNQNPVGGGTFFQGNPAVGGTGFNNDANQAKMGASGFGNTSFGATTSPFGTASTNTFGAPATNTFAPQSNNTFGTSNSMFNQSATPSVFGNTNAPTNPFGAPNTTPFGAPPGNTFGNNNTNTPFGLNTGGFGNLATNLKPFQPSKPRNEGLSKEKASKILVSCISHQDQYVSYSKEELRCKYLLNPSQFGSLAGGAASPFKGTSFGAATSTASGFLNPPANNNSAGGLFGTTANAIGGALLNNVGNSLFGGQTNQPQNTSQPLFGGQPQIQPSSGVGLFGTPQQTATPTGSLFPQAANNNQGGLFGNTGGLFNSMPQSTPSQGSGLFAGTQNNNGMMGQAPSLFGVNPTPNTFPQAQANTPENPSMPGSMFPNLNPSNLFTTSTPQGAAFQLPSPYMDPSMIWLAALQMQKYLPKQTPAPSKPSSIYDDDFYLSRRLPNATDVNVPAGYKLVPDDSSYLFKRHSYEEPEVYRKPSATHDDYEDLTSLRSRFKRQNLFEETEDTSALSFQSRDRSFERSVVSENERPSSLFNKGDETFIKYKLSNETRSESDFRTSKKPQSNLTSIEQLPTCDLYNISPSLFQLSRMTKPELSQVSGFTVRNKHAEVKFLDPISLVGVNIDEVITLLPSSVDISKEIFKCGPKRTLIKYFNFGDLKNVVDPEKKQKVIRSMEKWLRKMDVELVRMDSNEGEVTIKA